MDLLATILTGGVALLILMSQFFPDLRSGSGRGWKEFKKASNQVSEELDPSMDFEPRHNSEKCVSSFILWLVQGFGVGRIPVAPGTFGSLIGLVWFWILLLPKSPMIFLVGILSSFFVSVWFCSAGEKILHQRDPGSIVLDEIIALPICFGSWLAFLFFQKGFWPAPEYFFSKQTWPMTLGVFLLFRFFDVWKPWPVQQSQNLPGGWGVTVDDVLAAVYVNIVVAIVFFACK